MLYDQVRFIPEVQGLFTIQISGNMFTRLTKESRKTLGHEIDTKKTIKNSILIYNKNLKTRNRRKLSHSDIRYV